MGADRDSIRGTEVTRGAHWGLEGFIGGHRGGLMACNDPAWDRVISGLGLLLFNALHAEMFI